MKLPRILLIGGTGQVGSELRRSLVSLGEVVAPTRNQLPLEDVEAIRSAARDIGPEVIVNAAAYTAVDTAESERVLAYAINARAPEVLAEEAARLGALLVHYSTDYVFDGAKRSAYTESDAPNPLNVYGLTKLAGDQLVERVSPRHLILRTSWVYSARGRNFYTTIRRLLGEREEVGVVDDQVSAPTASSWIADATAWLLSRDGDRPQLNGVVNVCAAGEVSWFGFACKIRELAISNSSLKAACIVPLTSEAYQSVALRPRYSVLDTSHLRSTGFRVPTWQEQLKLVSAAAEGTGGQYAT